MEDFNVKNFETIFPYETKAGAFFGPLDLLLHLVKQARIEIKDIFVSEVTDQFMRFLDTNKIPIDDVGDYLGVAATLLYEKSKALLPKIEEFLPEEEDDSGKSLIRRLEELKLFKEMSVKLKELENVDRYYKQPDPTANDYRVVYKDFNFEGLIKAFSDLLTRVELEKEIYQKKEIPKEVFTVRDKMLFIQDRLKEIHDCSFFELFHSGCSRQEIVTTFQAVLELLKRQFITVVQTAVFDDITISIKEGGEDIGELGDLSEYN